ncbi:MAG: hypothetical protein ACLTEK_06925 [Christensenellales bacterium]
MSPEEITLTATAIAVELASGKSAEEIYMMKNLLAQISQTLLTLASQQQFINKKCNK